MLEYKINELLTLKLEDGKINIYILGKKFIQCKYLLINIPVREIDLYSEINSIDEAAEESIKSSESKNQEVFKLNIPPEVEFWGHCSNLQTWVENDYDTRLIHSNLAFPLLKKLTEVGDLKAKQVFKNEIGEKFETGTDSVRQFLIIEGFMDYLSRKEMWAVMPNPSEVEILKSIESEIGNEFKLCSDKMEEFLWGSDSNQLAFSLKENHVTRIDFYNCHSISIGGWKKIFGDLSRLTAINVLSLFKSTIRSLPKEIGTIKNLEGLAVFDTNLLTIHNSIGDLKNLRLLHLEQNELSSLPETICNLTQLERLELGNNKLKTIPFNIGNLKALGELALYNNLLKKVPPSIGNLTLLKKLNLNNNQLTELPESVCTLKKLENLSLRSNNLEDVPETLNFMKNLRELDVTHNKIRESSEIVKKLKKKKDLFLRI